MYLRDKSKWQTRNESDTRSVFLDPMMKALGWDSPDEVRRELPVTDADRKKKIDYVCLLNGVEKLVVEAKAIKEDISRIEFAKQTIGYAYNLSCNWAVLTDFEGLKIFYVGEQGEVFRDVDLTNIERFDENFENLWLISRESFVNATIERKAEDEGRKRRSVSIDQDLLHSLNDWRDRIYRDIKFRYAKKYSDIVIEEIVQKIIDRLIFIRKIEDMQGKRVLQALVRQEPPNMYKELKQIFELFNHDYNSKLFGEDSKDIHEADVIDLSNSTLLKVIEGMYQPSGRNVEYNFDIIDADVLGNIYEQYLGHILKKTAKTAKVTQSQTHRKEQGIYYTPTYVVEHIVRNTVGQLLTDKRIDIKKIRILDPACGSGSFLIKAYDYLLNYRRKKEGSDSQAMLDFEAPTFSRKTQIVRENIFGVDLDQKAVEIAQLNLLMKIAEFKERLPTLRNNIQVGNSLIADKSISTAAFDWNDKFENIVKNGKGFDVIIGNPPYVNVYLMDEKEREYFDKVFETTHLKYDLYTLFVEKAIKLLRNGGYMGFIMPYSVLAQPYAELLRKYILDNCCIQSIIDLSNYYVFQDASVKTVILILKKESNKNIRNGNRIKVITVSSYSGAIEDKDTHYIDQSYFYDTEQNMFRLQISRQNLSISDKMDSLSVPLSEICYVSKGIVAYSKIDDRTKDDFLHNKKINSKCVPYLEGKDVEKYETKYKGIFLEYDPLVMSRPTFRELHQLKKILVRAMGSNLSATFDDAGYYADQKLICCSKRMLIEKYVKASKRPKEKLAKNADKYDEKYVVGLLNSSLLWYYYKSLIFGGLSIHPEDIRKLPIRKIDFENQKETQLHDDLVYLVDKMLALHQELNKFGDLRSDEVSRIKREIMKTEEDIDVLVFELYGITAAERETIAKSLT